jgi:hypothetical protein
LTAKDFMACQNPNGAFATPVHLRERDAAEDSAEESHILCARHLQCEIGRERYLALRGAIPHAGHGDRQLLVREKDRAGLGTPADHRGVVAIRCVSRSRQRCHFRDQRVLNRPQSERDQRANQRQRCRSGHGAIVQRDRLLRLRCSAPLVLRLLVSYSWAWVVSSGMSGDPWRDSHSSTAAPPEFQLGTRLTHGKEGRCDRGRRRKRSHSRRPEEHPISAAPLHAGSACRARGRANNGAPSRRHGSARRSSSIFSREIRIARSSWAESTTRNRCRRTRFPPTARRPA